MKDLQKKYIILFSAVLIGSLLLGVFAYQATLLTWKQTAATTTHTHPTPVTPISSSAPAAIATPTSPLTPTVAPAVVLNPASVRGIDSGPPSLYPGISWTRLNYQSCGGSLVGNALKSAVELNHSQGVQVLLLLCQRPGPQLLNKQQFNDIAQAGADAIGCGNEQMKYNTYPTYVSPTDYARFFDLCEKTVHTVQPGIPVLMGSLDPHVGGIDYQPLVNQVGYLDGMEYAMNTVVHPGGHWHWRSQAIGLIDSWHNGYPSQYVNSLQALFDFWAQQFGVNLASGELGQHLWVVEGTGCVYGCGLNSDYDISFAHILTLITDVQTSLRYHIPFFYFSGKDFYQTAQSFWPMGVLDVNGHPKPLRQDLSPESRTLLMSCPAGQVRVTEQEQLLAMLYAGCTLPDNYISELS